MPLHGCRVVIDFWGGESRHNAYIGLLLPANASRTFAQQSVTPARRKSQYNLWEDPGDAKEASGGRRDQISEFELRVYNGRWGWRRPFNPVLVYGVSREKGGVDSAQQ